MKNLIFYSLLAGGIAFGQSQEITKLEEAQVYLQSISKDASARYSEFSFQVLEKQKGDFLKDPVQFFKENIDPREILEHARKADTDIYLFTLNHSKGYLRAKVDHKGDIQSCRIRLKDVALPYEVRNRFYLENKGWSMVGNLYKAHGRSQFIDKEHYRINLTKGNKSKIVSIKLQPDSNEALSYREE